MDRDVELKLGEKTYILSPTLDAMRKINRQFGSIMDAGSRIARYDFDAMEFVIKAGAGLSDKQSDQMAKELVKSGLIPAAPSIAKFINVLLDPEGRGDDSSEDGEPGEA